MSDRWINRRTLLAGGGLALAGVGLSGCDSAVSGDSAQKAYAGVDALNRATQEPLLAHQPLAREFAKADISPFFYANGNTDPEDEDYKALVASGFKDYRLVVDGLVNKPQSLSLDQLKAMPARTQITRHDCVEGWSCIGQWTGTPLLGVLSRAELKPEARYVVFHCFDSMDDGSLSGPTPFYGSIDLMAAASPQTILAYAMNDAPLPVRHGAPLRLRVERQLGYKMNKFIKRIEVVADFAAFGGGKGGYWEDNGYQWYAGI